MIKPTTKFASLFAASASIFRLIAFYGGLVTPETGKYVIFMHMLFILLAVFLTIRTNRIEGVDERKSMGHDIKTGFKAGGLYSVLTVAFVFIYFKYVDVNYFVFKQQELVGSQLKNDPSIDPVKAKASVESFFSLMNYCTVTLLALIVISFLYTVAVVMLNRFLLNRISR